MWIVNWTQSTIIHKDLSNAKYNKRKFKQLWSTIWPVSTKPLFTTNHLTQIKNKESWLGKFSFWLGTGTKHVEMFNRLMESQTSCSQQLNLQLQCRYKQTKQNKLHKLTSIELHFWYTVMQQIFTRSILRSKHDKQCQVRFTSDNLS